jgi:twinkle protein
MPKINFSTISLLNAHTSLNSNRFLKFRDLRDTIIEDIKRIGLSSNIKLKTLPKLSSYLEGFRENELTLLSGPTGAGKTTLISQMSLDYALQGVNTLWCSFEIQNSRLALTMMEQLSQKKFSSLIDFDETSFYDTCNKLDNLPIYFLDCFGKYDQKEFVDSLVSSIDEKGIKHIIIDNLQFMLSNSWKISLDKFDLFEKTISLLRALCNSYPIQLTLVVHPRKEDENTLLGLSSISGTAKATQEADNVLILQRIEGKNFIDVKKNRFSGKLGKIEIEFNGNTKEIREVEGDKI